MLSVEAFDACHFPNWTEAEMRTFLTREARFARQGQSRIDAERLAEVLVLRDRQADDRQMCLECGHYSPGRCRNYRAADLHGAVIGPDVARLLQRCGGFVEGSP